MYFFISHYIWLKEKYCKVGFFQYCCSLSLNTQLRGTNLGAGGLGRGFWLWNRLGCVQADIKCPWGVRVKDPNKPIFECSHSIHKEHYWKATKLYKNLKNTKILDLPFKVVVLQKQNDIVDAHTCIFIGPACSIWKSSHNFRSGLHD